MRLADPAALLTAAIAQADDRLERVAMELSVDGEEGVMNFSGDMLKDDVSLDSVKAPPDGEVVDEQDIPGVG